MGGISTVIFQRMYMALSFFVVLYLYNNIKIYMNNFYISKKMKIKMILNIVLGFLTQYYFCFYALIVFIIMLVYMKKEKRKNEFKRYFFIDKHRISG